MKVIFVFVCTLASFFSWGSGQIFVDDVLVSDLATAFEKATEGSHIRLGAGEFKQAGVLLKDYVKITGLPGKTHIHSAAVEGKAPLVIRASNILIEGIECSNVQVPHQNGACVRFEGENLELNNVYFHDSEQGLLTGHTPGLVIIRNSKFERLGKYGQAHGIYIGGGELYISNSQFLASKSEGMEVKSRAKITNIQGTTIASLNGIDSRLIDVPNGGHLVLKDNVLHQGNDTSNRDLIGFGLEGYKFTDNRIEMTGNIVIMERERGNTILHIKGNDVKTHVVGNVFVGDGGDVELYPDNSWFRTRKEAGIPAYPLLPSP